MPDRLDDTNKRCYLDVDLTTFDCYGCQMDVETTLTTYLGRHYQQQQCDWPETAVTAQLMFWWGDGLSTFTFYG